MPKHSYVTFCKGTWALLCSLLFQKLQLSFIHTSLVSVPLKLSLVFLHVEISPQSHLVRPNSGCWMNTGNFHLLEAAIGKKCFLKRHPWGNCRRGAMQRSTDSWALEKANYKRIDTISQRLSSMPQHYMWLTHAAAQGKGSRRHLPLNFIEAVSLIHVFLFQLSPQLPSCLLLLPLGRQAWVSFWETLG